MLGTNFPISDYYKKEIIDARTISRAGRWWSAALLITDPKNKKPMLRLYKWERTEGGWKTRQRFAIRKREDVLLVVDCLRSFADRLE